MLLKTPHCGVFLTQLRPPSITTIKELLKELLWQITLIWIPMHPTLLPGVHFGIGWGAFWHRRGANYCREGCI